MSIAKFFVMWLKRKELAEIIKFIKKNWQIEIPDEEYKVMMNFAKYSHFISIGSIALGWSASISGLIVQIWYNTESHLMKNLDSRLSINLLWVIYLPWSTKNFTSYSLTFLLQFYTSVLVAVMYNLFNSFVAILVLHFCGQICCIKIMLNFSIETPNNFFVNIKNIAKRHIKLIKITTQLNESLKMIILLELMACTATMCFQNYSTINMVFEGKNNHVFQILFSTTCQLMVLGNLCLYCWTGHQLTLCSSQIGDAIYESNWTSLRSVEIKLLNIIAFKKFTPLKISAGGFFDMSLDLFLLVIKTSLSYLSVLLAMKKRK
ncbi:odorant receptor 94a-like [Aphidius gifuensis]|uniref:odorant receptor 94a-like n=1 Tax=Aphidius gifuensis TaxID=684658 RepID=UPI001CDC5BA4|nr:odorant receptor 94a-like [Aphidius gifuensis]